MRILGKIGRKKMKRVSKQDTLQEQESEKNQLVSQVLEENIKQVKQLYQLPANTDINLREIKLGGSKKRAALFFIGSITDASIVSSSVIKPLLMNQDPEAQVEDLVYTETVQETSNMTDVVQYMNDGFIIIFIEGRCRAYLVPCPNFEGRSVEKSENEIIVQGPKESFTEKVIVNLSLIRKRIRNEELMVETMTVAKRSKNKVYVLYMKNLANEQLVSNVKGRLEALDVDAIQNLSLLAQYIEDRKFSIFSGVLFTERPDRAVSFLEDGHVILLMENSPDAAVVPVTFWALFHTAEDHYVRVHYANFIRVLRMFAIFITVFLSAAYVAITTFHSEMIPADLLLAIAGTRERVPFPVLFEILIMEIVFELIREAGLRVPNPMGPTIGIVGALILGQAAVQANIISPIVIIIVAMSGLSSFAINNINLNFAVRITRFMMIFVGGMTGIFGMSALFVFGMFYMTSLKSFGVPFLAPMTPHYVSSGDTIFRKMLKDERIRPGYLKPNDMKKK